MLDFRAEFDRRLAQQQFDYSVRGIVTNDRRVLPLGTDTKVLSTVFEAFARPVVYDIAAEYRLAVHEASRQNSYPDFTLMTGPNDRAKIAVDVKTTYRDCVDSAVVFTLGSYTSFIQPGKETKRIEFPHTDYADHWIIAYVYERLKASSIPAHVYRLDQLDSIPSPYSDVDVFVRRKWEIAGDKAGSGNTRNIGSKRATVAALRDGDPLFASEDEYLRYWRGYGTTAAERARRYKNLSEFRRPAR